MSDRLDLELIRPRLHAGRFGRIIHHFDQIDSTNAFARRLAGASPPPAEGTLVLAEAQTAGRGRMGRDWISIPGAGLYMTLILAPRLAASRAALVTLAAGVAVHETLERVTGLDVDIKWPNDLLIGRRKVAGILSELETEGGAVRALLVGAGINVHHASMPEPIREMATSLAIESGRTQSRLEILLDFLETFERLYDMLASTGPSSILDAWMRDSSFASGRILEVDDGARRIRGTTEGLNALGALRIRQAGGAVAEIYSGDVVYWER